MAGITDFYTNDVSILMLQVTSVTPGYLTNLLTQGTPALDWLIEYNISEELRLWLAATGVVSTITLPLSD